MEEVVFIRIILKEMEVEKVAELLVKVEVNSEEARENAGEIERTIRTVKECGRVIFNTLPYYYLP